jgi:hypothetical protein
MVNKDDSKTVMRVISALWMQPFVLDNWRQLPSSGNNGGKIGKPLSHLWESILIYNRQRSNDKFEASLDLPSELAPDSMDEGDRCRLQQLLVQLLPLGRRYPWSSEIIQQKS